MEKAIDSVKFMSVPSGGRLGPLAGALPLRVGWLLALLLLAGVNSPAKTIYVDNKLSGNCVGSYSVRNRDTSGHDGDGFATIGEAANVAQAGDTVLIRGGIYHHEEKQWVRNDVLWPKHSGTRSQPIVFKSIPGETVVLGEGRDSYPNDAKLSIARGVVTLKDVKYITIEGLEFRKVSGWLFARNCDHIIIRNCTFADALFGAKATARLVECNFCKFINCSFVNSYDSLQLVKSDHTIIQDCDFSAAAHTPLALRAASFTVVRNCHFENPFFLKTRAEKLVEVYDVKVDRRDPANPGVLDAPAYNSTKHNLFEYNYFGYTPFRPEKAAQPSAMQYSGQDGIIRRNTYVNPTGLHPDPLHPEATSGGMGIYMRWGGSWSGWQEKTDGTGGRWMGEGMEAGYVTHNRIYNNVFFGYDSGCINTPAENSMGKAMDPPPLFETNPSPQYAEKYAFADNLFLNNIIVPGRFEGHTKWEWHRLATGKPIALTMLGPINGVTFVRNNFYALNSETNALIFLRDNESKGGSTYVFGDADFFNQKYPRLFKGNLQKDPGFVDPNRADFQLQPGSPMVDAGEFLASAIGDSTGAMELQLNDVNAFFDGFGIEGEIGDVVQFRNQTETARIVRIDYAKKTLTLDRPLAWKNGQELALAYAGSAPDLGAHEQGRPHLVGLPKGANRVRGATPPVNPLDNEKQ